MSQYPKYKDSGVEWIGSTPSDWNVFKIKELTILRQQNLSVKRLANNTWYYYDIPTIQQTGKGRVEKGENIKSNKYLLEGNEILVSKLNPRKGTIVKSESNKEFPIICSTELIPVVPENINAGFLYYVLRNPLTADVFNSMVTSVTNSHQRINPKDIENFLISAPDCNTQGIISNYLDNKTSEIDSLISDKERLIELLEEKRQAVITETVTKGLDPNVKMKDSGIEWIGEIPEHWKVVKLKFIGKAIMGLLYSPSELSTSEEGKLVLRASNIQSGEIEINRNDNVYVNKKISDQLITQIGDILICARSGSRELIGKSGLIDLKSAGNSFGAFTTVYRSDFNEYISYVFQSGLFKSQIGTYLTSTINQLTMGNLRNLEIVFPPESDQNSIVRYLNEQLKSINSVMKSVNCQISKLTEYRESLIYEAVTGKIDVRDYVTETEEVH